MEISPIRLLWLLICSCGFGLAVGVLMDLHRLIRVCFGVRYSEKTWEKLYAKPLPILRRPLRPSKPTKAKRLCLNTLIFLQDVLLLTVTAIGVVLLNYYFNQGRFRIYTVAAVLLGFLLYYFTIGKLTMLCSEGIVWLVRSVVTVIFVLISRPIAVFVGFFGKNVKKLMKKIRKAIAKKRKRVYNKYKEKNALEKAEHGFLDQYV